MCISTSQAAVMSNSAQHSDFFQPASGQSNAQAQICNLHKTHRVTQNTHTDTVLNTESRCPKNIEAHSKGREVHTGKTFSDFYSVSAVHPGFKVSR